MDKAIGEDQELTLGLIKLIEMFQKNAVNSILSQKVTKFSDSIYSVKKQYEGLLTRSKSK
jgi:hypothetical protein